MIMYRNLYNGLQMKCFISIEIRASTYATLFLYIKYKLYNFYLDLNNWNV